MPMPPDLSLITKARHDGAAYVYSLLTGYRAQTYKNEKGERFLPAAKPGRGSTSIPISQPQHRHAAAHRGSDGQVTYADGQPAPTVDQMAKDVSAFLVVDGRADAREPPPGGLAVLIFLLIATILAYLVLPADLGDGGAR
jgi:ubiquinol-cytochrome c reductase cytochrome c1 subunit